MNGYCKPEVFLLGDAVLLISGAKSDFSRFEPNFQPRRVMETDLDD